MLDACFKFLMCMTYSFLSYKLAKSLSNFQFSFFLEKTVNHCEDLVIFRDIQHQIQEHIFHFVFVIVSCKIFFKLRSIFNPLKTIYKKFCDTDYPYRLFTSQYFRHDDFLLLSSFFMYLLLAFNY